MDAIDFRKYDSKDQFSVPMMQRELNKAYIAFTRTAAETTEDLPPISTGNWGGGAFLGNRPLKALLQWMAASHVGREVLYYSFKEKDVTEPLISISKALLSHQVTVGTFFQGQRRQVLTPPTGKLWNLLSSWPYNKEPNLYEWLNAKLKTQ